MIHQKLVFARAYEEEAGAVVQKESRPKFHMTPRIGWTNDPNGFSYYQGAFHLFYQSNPYGVDWDSMHWGHAVSKDLLHWEYLPCALAPDMPYDANGCFSGSAIALPDGRQLLMYTGVRKEGGDDGKDVQTQCIAVGDGVDYQKYSGNPVLDETCIPAFLSKSDFRDPKIWEEPDGTYRCVVGARRPEREGAILLCSSPDGFNWKLESTLIENDGRFGTMWECPDFYPLDGKDVLVVSPMEMLPEGLEYHNGHGTVCLIGSLDAQRKHFSYEHNQSVDYGIDFYAPQTTLAPDGRRIMIGWMQNWATCDKAGAKERKWFGQMTLPRELSIQNGRLYQKPIRELDQYRSNPVEYKNVTVSGDLSLAGIEGRVVDMEITIRPKNPEETYRKFSILFAQDDNYHTRVSYRPYESVLKFDRKHSGSRAALVHQRRCQVANKNGELKLRMILDKYSMEVFVNDGEQTVTATVMTDPSAKRISFCADGNVEMDIVKYDLFAGEAE